MAARTKFDLYAFTSGLDIPQEDIKQCEFNLIWMLMYEGWVEYDKPTKELRLLHSTEAKNGIIWFFSNYKK